MIRSVNVMNGSKSVRNLTQGKISSQILFFAIPVIIGNLLQELYNVVDTLIVGQTLGEIKLAAVGSTSSLNFFALGFFIGLSAGCSVITSQHFGANDMERVKKSVAAHIIIGVVSAVVLTVSFVLLVNPLLTMLGTTSDTFEYASRYLTIIYLGIPATMLYNLTASLLRSVGDSKTPLYLLLFSSVMNVGLDLLFIIVFRWDVSGAAIATVISQLVSAVLCCVYIFFKVKMLLPNRNSFKNLTSTVRDELKVGFPMGLQNSVISIGMMVLQYFVNQFGSYAVAAYTIGNRVQLLIQNPMNSMSTVIATFAGQNEGAGRYDRIKKGVNFCLLICIAYSIVIGAVSMIFAQPITGIFTSGSSQQTIDYSVQFIFWNCPFEWSLAMLFIYRGTIQGLKKARYAALVEGMDKSLGDILDYLNSKPEVAQNTIILFMSDNGGQGLNNVRQGVENRDQNYPARAGKGSAFMGGVREPMMVYWPGVTRPGTECAQRVIIEDFYPTILEMAGVKSYKTRQVIDGVSFADALKEHRINPDRTLIWHFPNLWGETQNKEEGYGAYSAILKGDYHLIYTWETRQLRLYNVKEDIGEQNDLAQSMPDKVKELAKELSDYLRARDAQRPTLIQTNSLIPYPDEK